MVAQLNGISFFAGLYESWRPSPDTRQRPFTILTTSPNDQIAPIHDRMPVIVRAEDADEWLFEGNDAEAIRPLLQAIPRDYLAATQVSPRVKIREER